MWKGAIVADEDLVSSVVELVLLTYYKLEKLVCELI